MTLLVIQPKNNQVVGEIRAFEGTSNENWWINNK